MKVIEGDLKIQPKTKICIISTRFNHFITDRLVEGAKDTYIRLGGDEFDVDLVLAPGAFEIPFVLEKVLSKGTYDGVCCLGAVIRGETPHFDYVSAEATKGIAAVSLKHGKPVTYGILTVNTIEQAIERAGTKAGNKGKEAMESLVELVNLQTQLS